MNFNIKVFKKIFSKIRILHLSAIIGKYLKLTFKVFSNKKVIKYIYISITIMFVYLSALRVISLFSTSVLLSADELSYGNRWQYYQSAGGLGNDRAILETAKKNALAKIKFAIPKTDKYASWIRYRGGSILGKIEIMIDENKKYIIDQRGPDRITWKKVRRINLEAGIHTIRILNHGNKSVNFDSIYLTNNFFFKPKVNEFNTDIIDDKIYNIVFNLLLIIIYLLSYLIFVYFLNKVRNFSDNFENLSLDIISRVQKNPTFLFAFTSIVFLLVSCFCELTENLNSADIAAVCAYISFVIGVVIKVRFLKKEN